MTTWCAIIALCISVLALFVATKNYRRKSGILVRGAFSLASSRDCNDDYVSSITLENLKDRTVTVFAIYLRVGHNYYVEVENFEGRPLLLKPFETYQQKYGPIQFYGINTNRINLNSLLKSTKVKKRLVLSTADGKYVVPFRINMWNPISDFFQNHLTAVIHPISTTYKEKYLGENIKYVIEFIAENDNSEVVLVHPEDYRLKKFKNFNLTQESLESSSSLTSYLEEQREAGTLLCKKFIVHDLDAWRARTAEFFTGRTFEAEYYGPFKYYLAGRLLTLHSDWKLKRENAKRRLKQTGT